MPLASSPRLLPHLSPFFLLSVVQYQGASLSVHKQSGPAPEHLTRRLLSTEPMLSLRWAALLCPSSTACHPRPPSPLQAPPACLPLGLTASHILLIFSNVFIFNWRIIALQYCVGFCHTSTWISHRYTYAPSLLNLPPTSPCFWSAVSWFTILCQLQVYSIVSQCFCRLYSIIGYYKIMAIIFHAIQYILVAAVSYILVCISQV